MQELKHYFSEELKMEFLQFAEVSSVDIFEGITTYIADHHVDMVAMLTRKRNLLERIFHKSMTRKMAYHTHIPLLAFHN
jgi:nucleotide-binding universal stress UspA family protein